MLETVFVAVAAGALAIMWVAWKRPLRRPRAMKQYARDLVAHPEYHQRIDEEYAQLWRALDEARAARQLIATEDMRPA